MSPAWFNARKAAQVVAFFAKAQGGQINVLKAVKLVYLADREAMKAFDAPILCDNFVSMDFGPVNSLTLNQINGTADDDTGWDEFITDRAGHTVGLRNKNIKIQELDELSAAELKVLNFIWERFGKMDRFELADYTHKNCPEWEDPKGSSMRIPLERIFKYLGKQDGTALAQKLESERIMDETFERADALPAGEEIDSAYAIRASE
jgi:uncharacterized phage-associated protein